MTDQPTAVVLPCLVLVDGSLGSGVLIPGVTYRVAEVREHWEPTGVEGAPQRVSTVIRFDPTLAPESLTVDHAIEAHYAQTVTCDEPGCPLDWHTTAAAVERP